MRGLEADLSSARAEEVQAQVRQQQAQLRVIELAQQLREAEDALG